MDNFNFELVDVSEAVKKSTIASKASVKNADRIMIINDGIVEAIAPHDELIQTNATYQEIYNSQLKREDENRGDI